ncbi:type VI secretion system protein TssA [Photobacterium swingsii]|uniref:type VI secretion system protein TssA n=1 Tax=Photobacterium swingsii TaxID=680026 RepID=UPI004068EF13
MRFTEDKIRSLSNAISDDHFCGIYLKSDRKVFRPLRNEFNLAQTSQRQLVQNPDPNEIDALHESNVQNWSALANSLFDVFESSSRDVELAAWMLAAQIVIDPSLNTSSHFSLWFSSLVEEHWLSLQPILPAEKIRAEDDFAKQKEITEFKLKAFVQLVGESEDSSLLYSPLLLLPLIGDLNYSRYLSEERKGNLAEVRQTYQTIAMSHRSEVTALAKNLESLRTNLSSIDAGIKQHCQAFLLPQPSFQFVLGLLTKLLQVIEYIAGIKPESQAESTAPIEPAPAETKLSEEAKSVRGGAVISMNPETVTEAAPNTITPVSFTSIAEMQVQNRDQAFHQMRELAEFFMKTEPHSPVSYLLEKAIRWGYLSLPELMTELLSDQQDTINRVFNLSGLDEDGQTHLPERQTVQPSVAATVSAAEPSTPVVQEEPAQEQQEEQVVTSNSDSLW